MKLSDWLTIIAIVLGPVLALTAQRVLDRLREKKRQRMGVYITLMGTRANFLAPEHVRALNSIDVVFSGRHDGKIREAWQQVLAHVATPATNAGWLEKYADLKADLLQAMGSSLSFHFTTDHLKRQIYAPQAHLDVDSDLFQIRQALTKALTADGLKVINPPLPADVQHELMQIRQALTGALTSDGLKIIASDDRQ